MAILAFHNISDTFKPGLNNYKPARLKRLLSYITGSGYRIVSLSEYVDSGSPADCVSLTFDDGYDDFYLNAFPILAEMNLPATLFVPPGYIGKRSDWDFHSRSRHLDRDQLLEVSAGGVKVESHGLTHACLAKLNDRFLSIELKRSKEILEEMTNREVNFIAYPFGIFNSNVEKAALEVGYRKGFSLSYYGKEVSRFTIPRYAVYSYDTNYSVKNKLGGGALNKIERFKGSIINSFAHGTALLNQIRKKNG